MSLTFLFRNPRARQARTIVNTSAEEVPEVFTMVLIHGADSEKAETSGIPSSMLHQSDYDCITGDFENGEEGEYDLQ